MKQIELNRFHSTNMEVKEFSTYGHLPVSKLSTNPSNPLKIHKQTSFFPSVSSSYRTIAPKTIFIFSPN